MGFSVGSLLGEILQLYSFLVLIWCLLSWFPNIDWYKQPFKLLDSLVRPICAPFRKLIPPINGIDLSPMIAMFVIQFIGQGIARIIP